MPDLVLADIEAKANTNWMLKLLMEVFFIFALIWSVVTICTCGTSHPQHAKKLLSG